MGLLSRTDGHSKSTINREETNPGVFETLAEEYHGATYFGSLRAELLEFWRGGWGSYLRDCFGLEWLDISGITEQEVG